MTARLRVYLSRTLGATGRPLAAALIVLAATVAILVMFSGGGSALDRQLQSWRDTLRSRPATGRLVLVEIDARSLSAIARWPWPRSRYYEAVRALNRAGAAMIAFDVDFSARSSPQDDASFAAAIAASRAPIVLPSFQQPASERGGGTIESLPLPALRAHALIGSVNIYADPDGLVRAYPYGFALGGVPRPSIGALLAGASGRINRSFPIDGAIAPDSVPRISFIDLIQGRVPSGRLAGKAVLIGASAIELGDRYPMPRHGVIPGALIQLLAGETLIQGTAPVDRGGLIPLLALLLMLPLVLRLPERRRGLAFAAAGLLLLALPLALELCRLGTVAVAPALAGLLAAGVAHAAASALRNARIARTVDADTGLPNRRALGDSLEAAAGPCTVVGLRVESYGEVLGVMGRARAAELMKRTAERVAAVADASVHLVEENALAWLLPDQGEEVFHLLEAIAALLRPGLEISGRRLELSAGLGIAAAQPHASADAIGRALLAADTATAKGSRWERYSDELDRALDWQLSLAAEVDQAMASGHIWVAYQPKLDLGSGRIAAAEALVRWNHPTRGAITPADFIPALETSGRIYDLTLYVLERALRDMRGWRELGRRVGVAVNVSALLPADPLFPGAVERLLAEHAVPPADLTLEVTESVSLADPDAAIAALERLSATGVTLSIDDYGTGQSTLSYLKRLPAREIKIDQSFVKALDHSRSDQAMVRSTIELAHELGFKVVAEGVETQAVLEQLRGFGCDVAQGWLIGRPMPAEQLTPLLEADSTRAAA